MQITDADKYRPALERMIIDQTQRLNKKIPGQYHYWRHLFYAFNTDRYQAALDLLLAYISDIKFRKINIDYMQSQLQPNPDKLFYNDIEICPLNTNIIWQLVNIQTNEDVGQLTHSKEILREFLVANNVIRRIEGGGIRSWHQERIAYCEFHKRTLSFKSVLIRHCLHRNGKFACKNLIAINYPFWESTYAKKLKNLHKK